ncbi:MAG: ABC transporter substrate-binding protein [Pseudomonadota bacterium]
MKKTLKQTLVAGVAVAALAAPLSAMADVKIGFLGGFTGPIESLVPPIGDAAQLAAKHVNDQGGILGGTMEVVTGDTTCADATAAANAADRLVNVENVTAIVGALCSGATISSANNAGVPGNVVMISPASTSPALTALEDNDLVFRTAPSDAYQGEVLARLLNSKGVGDIAITYVNNDYGKGFADALEAAYSGLGGTVAANEAHEDGKADYRAELGSLSSSGATTLVVLAYADGSGQTVVRQALEAGDFTTFVGGDGMVSDTLPENAGASIDGMIATRPGTPEVPGAEIYAELATAGELDPTATFGAQSYDAAFILALAIQKQGSADRDGLAAAVRDVASAPGEVILPGEWEKAVGLLAAGTDINYEGGSGSHEFDAAGDVPGLIVEMTVTDGKFVEVGVAE